MVIFTADSLALMLDLLKQVDFKTNHFYFNNGHQQDQVVGLDIQYEDFECNGSFQRLETRYRLKLTNGERVEFWFNRGQMKINTIKASQPMTDIGTPTQISQYNF
ncbi:hypothetical protein [Vibrio harveyi]